MPPEAAKGIDIVFQYGALGVMLIFTLTVNLLLVFRVMPADRAKADHRLQEAQNRFMTINEGARRDFLDSLEKHRAPLLETMHAMTFEFRAFKEMLKEWKKP